MSTPPPPPPPTTSPTSSSTIPRTPSPKFPSTSAPPETLNFQPPGIIITSAPEEPFIRSAAPSPSSSRFAAEERSRRSAAPSPEERSLKTPSPSPSPSLTGAVVAGPSQGGRSRSSSILGAGVPAPISGAGNGYSAAGVSGSMPPPPAPTSMPGPPGSTRLAAFPRTRFSSHHVEFEGRPPQQPELLVTPLSSYFEGRHTVDPASIADSGRSSSSSSRPYSKNAAMVIPPLSGLASQHGGDPSSSGFQRSGPVVGTGTGQNEDAVPRRRGRSAFERVQDFMRGACMPIAGRKRGHEEMEDGWALSGMVGDGVGNGFGNGLVNGNGNGFGNGNGNANGFGNENGFVNANGFGNGFGNGNENGNENGVDGYFHEEDGDVDMDGANAMATDDAVHGDDAMDGDATIHGATMDAVETGTEHTEPQNGYEDHDEALATAPVWPPSMHTTHHPTPYTPHRSAPLPDPHQMVPPTIHSAATRVKTRDYSGSIQLPRPEAVSREREGRYGSLEETLPCGCSYGESLGEEGCSWKYCEEHQCIKQEEEDGDEEDGGEPEEERGRSRYRDC